MKIGKLSAAVVAFVLFGAVNVYEVGERFYWYSAADLTPGLFFLYSLGIAIRDFACCTSLPIAFVYLMGRFAKWLLIVSFCSVVLIDLGAWYVLHAFHADLEQLWLPLFLNTSISEVVSFIKMIFTPVFLAGFFFVAFILAVCCRVIYVARYPRSNGRNFAIGLLLLLPFVVLNSFLVLNRRGLVRTHYTGFLLGGITSWTKGKGVRDACLRPKLPSRLQVEADMYPNVVFVIGESSTRNSWHLYGYSRNTTPRMDKICREGGGVAFTDVVGTQPDTVQALSLLLTDVTLENRNDGNWTVAEVYRRAGYRCVLISQQWGGEPSKSSLLYQVFNGCEKRISVSCAYPDRKKCFDEDIVPLFKQELEQTPSKIAVFIHLAGMHYPVQNVIPEHERHFNNEIESECLKGLSERDKDRNNRYDDAVLYEDKVLASFIDVLDRSSYPSCLMFLSDHGESPRARGWRDFHDREVYEIPLVLWVSKQYRQMFPALVQAIESVKHRPLQQDELTLGMVRLGCITGIPRWDEKKDFLSPCFIGRSPRVIENGHVIY